VANQLPLSSSVQELAALRDIHLPAPINWWPLALGWYVLGLVVLALFFFFVFFLVRYYLNNRKRRQALQLLKKYQEEYQMDGNGQLMAARVSELLKRVALVYFERSRVASLQGDKWIDFLNHTGKGLDFKEVRDALLRAPYQPNSPCDLNLLFKISGLWISQRRGPCLS
jgi:hypothetical protein